MINRELKILFIHPERTGGTTAQNYLGGITNSIHPHHHATLREYREKYPEAGEYYVFMTIRCPQKRVESYQQYQQAQGRSSSLGDAIRALGAKRYKYYAQGRKVNYLLTEFLDYDLPILGEAFGIPRREVRRANARKYPTAEWTNQDRADLLQYLRSDIELYEDALERRSTEGYSLPRGMLY